MARITVEDCLEKIDSPYDLVLLAKERTSQLNAGDSALVSEENDKNTVIALREIEEETISLDTLKENLIKDYQIICWSKKMQIQLTEEIWKEGNMYVSYCPELDMASCGENLKKAKENLIEAIGINMGEMQKQGTFQKYLTDAGLLENKKNVWITDRKLVAFDTLEIAI